MKTKNTFLTIPFLFVSFFCTAQADEVDRYLKKKMEQFHIPGIALIVLKNNRIVKESYYGYANIDNNVPVSN